MDDVTRPGGGRASSHVFADVKLSSHQLRDVTSDVERRYVYAVSAQRVSSQLTDVRTGWCVDGGGLAWLAGWLAASTVTVLNTRHCTVSLHGAPKSGATTFEGPHFLRTSSNNLNQFL